MLLFERVLGWVGLYANPLRAESLFPVGPCFSWASVPLVFKAKCLENSSIYCRSWGLGCPMCNTNPLLLRKKLHFYSFIFDVLLIVGLWWEWHFGWECVAASSTCLSVALLFLVVEQVFSLLLCPFQGELFHMWLYICCVHVGSMFRIFLCHHLELLSNVYFICCNNYALMSSLQYTSLDH